MSSLGGPARPQEPGTLRIGSLFGVSVYVRMSWLLIAVLIAYLLAPAVERVEPGLGALRYVAGLAFAVLLTLSLLLHELSHALVARHYGIAANSITLHFIGGVTAIESEPPTPKQEAAISGAGPLTSLALGGVALALVPLMPDGLLHLVMGGLAGANLVVGVLNLVPGLPLDGGHVLRAGLWRLSGDPHRATVGAGWAGRGVAVLLLLTPLLLSLADVAVTVLDYLLAGVIAWFLWSAASSAVVSGRVRARLPALAARDLARRCLTVAPDLPLAEAVRRAREQHAGAVVTVDPAGLPLGVVSEAAVHATPEDRRPWVPVSAVTRSVGEVRLPADLSGERLLRAMQAAPATEYVLVEADGSVFGVLAADDVDAAFQAAAR